MKSNYCPYVYKGLRISFGEKNEVLLNSTKPCCHVISEVFTNIPEEHNVDNILQTQNLKYFQDYFDNNDDLPPACLTCQKLEDAGQVSHRTRAISKEDDYYDIYRFDIVIGNSCNLACPFCSSHASSLINVLSNKHLGEHVPEMWQPRSDIYDASFTKVEEAIFDILSKYKCQTIKVIGGEPFLKENWSVFEKLLENGKLKDSILEITTNGTIVNKRLLESLAKTKKTVIRTSIDSVGKNYDFIRWPYTFDKIFKNMKYMADNKADNTEVQLSALINVINFEHLPDIEDYVELYQSNTGDFSLSYEVFIKPAGQSMDWRYLSQEIVDDVCNKLKNKKLVDLIKNESLFTNKENTTNTLKFLLKQRNMKAEDVFKPATREHFNL